MNARAETFRRRPAARFPGLLVLLLGICVDPAPAHSQIERVSLNPDGLEFPLHRSSSAPSLSADGRYVLFNVQPDYLFLHDRQTVTTRTVPPSWGYRGSLNADGRYMAYSATAVGYGIYVLDLQSGLRELVSISSNGVPGNNGNTEQTSLSADGRFVVFASNANNLVPDDTNGALDVFVHDRDLGTTERVNVDSAGVQGNKLSLLPSISADGYSVAFYSDADNLVANDSNGYGDVFVHDRRHRTTERVSVASHGAQANSYSEVWTESISADGQRVVFNSSASNLVPGDTNGEPDVFVRDRALQVTRRINVGSDGRQANNGDSGPGTQRSVISGNGSYVAFNSHAGNLVPGDSNNETDLFVHDLETGATSRVNVGYDGTESNGFTGYDMSFSADGRILAFLSHATNLVPGDTNGAGDIFVATLDGPKYVSLVGVPDLNGNGSPELAAVRMLADNQAEVLIRDGATEQALGALGFDESGLPLVDLAVVPDISGEGYPELAALFLKPDGPAIVQLKDAATGSDAGRLLFFGKDWDTTAVTGIDRGMGGPEIAVLGVRKDTLRGGIELRPAADDGTVARMQFPVDAAREYRDLAALEDSNGDGHPELASLFTLTDGTAKVVIKDGVTQDRLNTFVFPGPGLGAATAIGVAGLGDLSGDGSPDIAVLFRKANGQGVVQVRDAGTGRWIHQMQFFGKDWYVVAVTRLDSNGDGVPELAVLGVRDDGTAAAVQVRDASSAQALNWIDFPAAAVN